jgi:hypothetical protein
VGRFGHWGTNHPKGGVGPARGSVCPAVPLGPACLLVCAVALRSLSLCIVCACVACPVVACGVCVCAAGGPFQECFPYPLTPPPIDDVIQVLAGSETGNRTPLDHKPLDNRSRLTVDITASTLPKGAGRRTARKRMRVQLTPQARTGRLGKEEKQMASCLDRTARPYGVGERQPYVPRLLAAVGPRRGFNATDASAGSQTRPRPMGTVGTQASAGGHLRASGLRPVPRSGCTVTAVHAG